MVALEVYTEGGERQGFIRRSSPCHGAGMCWFTKLRGAYALACVRWGKEWRAAFVCEYGHLEHAGVPFGLCQSPATLQRSVTAFFRDFLDSCVTAYLGDTFNLLRHVEEHVVPVWRFSPASTLICLQSQRRAFL